jgi:hypothetical protein
MFLEPSSKHKIVCFDGLTICLINVCGTMTDERLFNQIKTIQAVTEQQGLLSFLMDLRQAPYKGSIVTQYELVCNRFATIGFGRSLRTALLVDEADNSYEFLETVASNNGYGFKRFKAMPAAIDWLRVTSG